MASGPSHPPKVLSPPTSIAESLAVMVVAISEKETIDHDNGCWGDGYDFDCGPWAKAKEDMFGVSAG